MLGVCSPSELQIVMHSRVLYGGLTDKLTTSLPLHLLLLGDVSLRLACERYEAPPPQLVPLTNAAGVSEIHQKDGESRDWRAEG